MIKPKSGGKEADSKVIRNHEDKIITCLECDNQIKCTCLEFDSERGCYYFCSIECYKKLNAKQEMDLDLEFGEYEGHYYFCELGNQELKRDRDNYKEIYYKFYAMYYKFYAKHKKLKEQTSK